MVLPPEAAGTCQTRLSPVKERIGRFWVVPIQFG
jgi:hypothetical protein